MLEVVLTTVISWQGFLLSPPCQIRSMELNVLKIFIDLMHNLPFYPKSLSKQLCPNPCKIPRNNPLHDLGCGRSLSLTDHLSAGEFAKELLSRHISTIYHRDTLDGRIGCNFLPFRIRNMISHYSLHPSFPFRAKIVAALHTLIADKRAFAFMGEKAMLYLNEYRVP